MLKDVRVGLLRKLKVWLYIFVALTVVMLSVTVWQALNPEESLRVWCCVVLCWFGVLTCIKYRLVRLYEFDNEWYIDRSRH